MGKRFLGLLIVAMPFIAHAQDKWDLRRCVDYAVKNNISVRQADVQARISALQLRQSKMNQLPSANFSTNLGTQFGRSVDPTTNQFTTTQFLYQDLGLSGSVLLFGFGQLKNGIAASRFNAAAALKDVDRAANDVSINVATYYLQVLAAKEQINIAEVQIGQDQAQLQDTKARVDAGALPELNLAEIESQMATDSANLITARATFQQNVLSLKGLLNMDAGAPFELDTPPIDEIPLESLADLQPDVVFQLAQVNQPLLKVNDLKIKGAEKTIQANKAALYPRLSAAYSLGSRFSNSVKEANPTGYVYVPTEAKTTVNGTDYAVQTRIYDYAYSSKPFSQWWNGYSSQLNSNFSQQVGIGLTVPIFNSGNTNRVNYEQSKLNLRSLQLQQDQATLDLKQSIYKAYIDATSAMQKFYAGQRSVASAQKAYDFSFKRYQVGLLSSIDLLTNQNNLLKAKLQQLTNQYEYVFRMKLLEFYKGQGMKL
jgi:outer membrane protein